MEIHLHNTLTGKKEKFTPIKPGVVGMYHCGPTVYHYPHIGNMRAYILADSLRRLFEYSSPLKSADDAYEVNQVINITDVGHLTGDNAGDADTGEDKIESGAEREHATVTEIVEKYTRAFHDDITALNIRTVGTHFPKASDYIKEQIEMIKKMSELGYTYELADGIYFDTARFPEYGKLGNINIAGLKEGARIGMVSGKRHATDFALWKFSGEKKRLQEWDPADFGADFGVGFPGWHIECSAMSRRFLGEHFDIHTGGIDHIPVHHNNEIAQSESIILGESDGRDTKPFVNYWIHSAFLNIDNAKISKSSGEFVRLEDFKGKGPAGRDIDPLAFRYLILSGHYMTPLNFTWEAVIAAEKALNGLRDAVFTEAEADNADGKINDDYLSRIEKAVADDLGTPQAIAILWEIAKDDSISVADKRATFIAADALLGLGLEKMPANISGAKNLEDAPDEIRVLVDAREKARAEKDWKKADEIRDVLIEKGYEVKDK